MNTFLNVAKLRLYRTKNVISHRDLVTSFTDFEQIQIEMNRSLFVE